jgi:hypothetical protein
MPSLTNRSRDKAPVFVLGSVRSGTTLLYHMLLSAGGFAVYRSESNVFNLLEPRFGDLHVRRNREKLMRAWLGSKLFQRSGLDADSIKTTVLAECHNAGDFLEGVMGEIARRQGVTRWAECTPEHLLYLPRIKQTIADALIIHIIRDGRDVALSAEKQNWVRPLFWDKSRPRFASALYWEWMVRKGRADGRKLGADYCEVSFEKLISDPRETLTQLGEFIEHDLDYDRILTSAIGSVTRPNTSFESETDDEFNPVGRWRSLLTPEELANLEALVGDTLKELGYPLASQAAAVRNQASIRRMRTMYLNYFNSKLWLKTKTPLGRWFLTKDLSWL